MRFARSIAAVTLVAGLLLSSCSGGDSDGDWSPAPTASTASGDRVKAAQDALDTLVSAAGSDQVLYFGFHADRSSLLVAPDGAVGGAQAKLYVLPAGAAEATPEPGGDRPIDSANTPMTPDEIDLAKVLSASYECAEPDLTVTAVGFAMRIVLAGCPGDEYPRGYWAADGEPIGFDLSDWDTVGQTMTRMAEGSSEGIDSLLIVENGTAKTPDGKEITYSDIQVSFADGEQVRTITVDDRGFAHATISEMEALAPFELAELDIAGLESCAAELRQNSGRTSGSVHVWRPAGADFEYQWRDAEGSLYVTGPDCQPLA